MVVVSITNALEMDTAEIKSYVVLQRLRIRDQIRNVGSQIVNHVAQVPKIKKLDFKSRRAFTQNFMDKMEEFKDLKE